MILEMQQLREGEWINIAYGVFDDIHEALQECNELAKLFKIPISELRVKIIDKIPEEDLRYCTCGSEIKFTMDGRCICVACNKIYGILE